MKALDTSFPSYFLGYCSKFLTTGEDRCFGNQHEDDLLFPNLHATTLSGQGRLGGCTWLGSLRYETEGGGEAQKPAGMGGCDGWLDMVVITSEIFLSSALSKTPLL